MVRHLPSLEMLDMSYARAVGMDNLFDILNTLNGTGIRNLCFRRFQQIGSSNFQTNLNNNFQTLLNTNVTFPSLVELDLSNNAIARLPFGISYLAPNLKYLDVSENLLLNTRNLVFMIEALSHPTIVIINYYHQGNDIQERYTPNDNLPVKPVHGFNQFASSWNHNTEFLNANSTHSLQKLTPEQKMNRMQNQFIVNCINQYSDGNFSTIINISDIYNYTRLCQVLKCLAPPYFDDLNCGKRIKLPKLAEIIDANCMMSLHFPIGQNLESLYMSELHFEQSETVALIAHGKLCLRSNNSLKHVTADNNNYWLQSIKLDSTLTHLKGFHGLDNLEYISLANNTLNININTLSINSTYTFNNLFYLDISGNILKLNSDLQICKRFPKLQNLKMNNVSLTTVPNRIFENCSDLESLSFNYNNLSQKILNSQLFENLPLLKKLSLVHDNISFIPPRFQNLLQTNENLTLNLEDNPLSCECGQQEFIKWLDQQNRSQRLLHYKGYYCNAYGPYGGSIFISTINRHPKVFWAKCYSYTLEELIIGMVTPVGILLLLLTIVYLFRKRWKIKYLVFRIQLKLSDYFRPKPVYLEDVRVWKYDAFISYCDIDRFWVIGTMRKHLEDVYGFKLCLQDRDYEPGDNKFYMTVGNMMKSREIILILSNLSINDEWVQFELSQALLEIQKRGKKLIIIKLDHIDSHLLDKRIANILENEIYLQWTEKDIDAQVCFWNSLIQVLYHRGNSSCMETCCCFRRKKPEGYQELLHATNAKIDDDDEAVSIQNLQIN